MVQIEKLNPYLDAPLDQFKHRTKSSLQTKSPFETKRGAPARANTILKTEGSDVDLLDKKQQPKLTYSSFNGRKASIDIVTRNGL